MFGSVKKAGALTVIGHDAVFRGSLELKGALQVDGRVEGDLEVAGDVSVGPKGVVTGDLRSDRLTVSGVVEGEVRVRDALHIRKGGRVGDSVFYGSLEVERGGSLLGHSGAIADADDSQLHASEPEHQKGFDLAERRRASRPPALGHA